MDIEGIVGHSVVLGKFTVCAREDESENENSHILVKVTRTSSERNNLHRVNISLRDQLECVADLCC